MEFDRAHASALVVYNARTTLRWRSGNECEAFYLRLHCSFLFAVSYSLVAGRAQGQATVNRLVGITSAGVGGTGGPTHLVAVAENGDWYYQFTNTTTWPTVPQPWVYGGNVLSGAVQVEGKSWTGVKQDYRK